MSRVACRVSWGRRMILIEIAMETDTNRKKSRYRGEGARDDNFVLYFCRNVFSLIIPHSRFSVCLRLRERLICESVSFRTALAENSVLLFCSTRLSRWRDGSAKRVSRPCRGRSRVRYQNQRVWRWRGPRSLLASGRSDTVATTTREAGFPPGPIAQPLAGLGNSNWPSFSPRILHSTTHDPAPAYTQHTRQPTH